MKRSQSQPFVASNGHTEAEPSAMVERVARAIDPTAWAFLDLVAGRVPPHKAEAVTRSHQLRQARAAVEALRRRPLDTSRIGPAMGLAMERERLSNISIGAIWAVWDALIDTALDAPLPARAPQAERDEAPEAISPSTSTSEVG